MSFTRLLRTRNGISFAPSGRVARRVSQVRPSWNQVARRRYATEGHDSHQKSSDVPWALGALVLGAPSCAYLWMNGTARQEGHGHDDTHGGHDEEEHEEPDEASKEEEGEGGNAGSDNESGSGSDDAAKKEPEGGSKEEPKDKAPEGSEPEDSSDDQSGGETPDTSDDEADGSGSHGEGKSDQGGDNQGEEGDSEEKPRWGKKNKGPLDAGQQVPTHAKHKGSPHEDLTKSKKAEGIHDTAKVLQPIDPKRPAKPKGSDE